MFFDKSKRITAFVGHYGSGKTEIAVNFALQLAKERENVAIADLDIVNPYFRTKDAQIPLESAGVRVVVPPYANTNVDLPVIPPEVHALFDNDMFSVVLDIGGDDDGAVVLGSFSGRIKPDECELLCVINKSRPLTATPQSAAEYVKMISDAARIPVSGIINNTNLASETTADLIIRSNEYALECARLCGVPLAATTARARFAPELEGRVERLWPLRIKVYHPWLSGLDTDNFNGGDGDA